MMSFKLFIAALACLAIDTEARTGIIDGIPLTSMAQFPHAVTIVTTEYNGRSRFSAGSILSINWILTSLRCLYNSDQFELIFNRTNLLDLRSSSFSIRIDNSSVFRNPSYDVALIKLPIDLKFSRYIQPISLLTDVTTNLTGRFAVMAGIANGTLNVSYGQFTIISPEECKEVHSGLYDERTQICTQGFQNNTHVPCGNNEGGGLLIGWPTHPVLVGTFNAPTSCLSRIPAEYMRVTAFVPWIRSVMSRNSISWW